MEIPQIEFNQERKEKYVINMAKYAEKKNLDVKNLDDLHKLAYVTADTMLIADTGMRWSDLPDTNSLYDVIDVGMSMEELLEAVIDAVNERLADSLD